MCMWCVAGAVTGVVSTGAAPSVEGGGAGRGGLLRSAAPGDKCQVCVGGVGGLRGLTCHAWPRAVGAGGGAAAESGGITGNLRVFLWRGGGGGAGTRRAKTRAQLFRRKFRGKCSEAARWPGSGRRPAPSQSRRHHGLITPRRPARHATLALRAQAAGPRLRCAAAARGGRRTRPIAGGVWRRRALPPPPPPLLMQLHRPSRRDIDYTPPHSPHHAPRTPTPTRRHTFVQHLPFARPRSQPSEITRLAALPRRPRARTHARRRRTARPRHSPLAATAREIATLFIASSVKKIIINK